MSTVLFVLQNKKELQSMQKCESIIEKMGLTQISDETAKCLLDAFYKVEKEQGYLNESVTTIISYLHMREEEAKKPIVRFQSRGESGNIYYLMKLVADALDDDEATKLLWKRVRNDYRNVRYNGHYVYRMGRKNDKAPSVVFVCGNSGDICVRRGGGMLDLGNLRRDVNE